MIQSMEEHKAALSRIDEIFDAPVGTPEGDELGLLVKQVEAYETERYPIPPPDPVDAIEFRMEQEGRAATGGGSELCDLSASGYPVGGG